MTMDTEEFRRRGHEIVDWLADYYTNIERYPVRSQTKPHEVFSALPDNAPQKGESFEEIFTDFASCIMPGITHWQHPSFFAYFPANASYPSILAEMLTAGLGLQCMSWQTSPAATELEERVMQWLAHALGLPESFTGVIQDGASTATLSALLTAREKKSRFLINSQGFQTASPYIVYCSSEAHSSIEKAAKIAGFGSIHVRKIKVDDRSFALIPAELEKAIHQDRENGFTPCVVVAAIGTTGSTAIDPLVDIGRICRDNELWLHVDAAYGGTALLLPAMRWMIEGIEMADSLVMNPHKWMFTNFDCSAYFVKDTQSLRRTFEILPEYLKTKEGDSVTNFRDWGVQLGRRFRALKLWFVLRSFGIEGLQAKIADHLRWAQEFAQALTETEDFEILAPIPLSTVCFRYKPKNMLHSTDSTEASEAVLTSLNSRLLEALNQSGKLYVTHTTLAGKYSLRFCIGQTNTEKRHVEEAIALILHEAQPLT